MQGHECHHCKQWIEAGEAHDCWTTTEAALTQDLPEELQEAWERLRETAQSFGEQRIYASHHCIMFSRKACYVFVRPKRSALEVCFFLGRTIKSPQVRRTERASQRKIVHFVNVRHRDEVEPPITEWLQEAFEVSDQLSARTPVKKASGKTARRSKPTSKRRASKKKAARRA